MFNRNFSIVILIFICLLIGNPLESQWSKQECKEYYDRWKLWSLRYNECIENLESCEDDDARRAYQRMTSGYNGFSSTGCLQLLSTLSDKELKVFLACPADALLINSDGKKIGWHNGVLVNEIPGATPKVDAESEYYVLPLYDAYRVEIYGKGRGSANISFIADRKDGSFPTQYFESIPLQKGIKYVGTIEVEGQIQNLSSPSADYSAKTKNTSSVDPIWSEIQGIGRNTSTEQSRIQPERSSSSAGSFNRPPLASFSMMPQNPSTDDRIVLVSTSSDADNDNMTYKWYVDDFVQGIIPQVEVDPLASGYHTIRLEVTDAKGAFDQVEKTIFIDSAPSISAPESEIVVDQSDWQRPTGEWEDSGGQMDIMEYVPYIVGGFVALLLFRMLFRGNKKKEVIVSQAQEEPLVMEQPQSETKEEDDGFVEVHFCTQCGSAGLPGAKFCAQCGAPVTDSA